MYDKDSNGQGFFSGFLNGIGLAKEVYDVKNFCNKSPNLKNMKVTIVNGNLNDIERIRKLIKDIDQASSFDELLKLVNEHANLEREPSYVKHAVGVIAYLGSTVSNQCYFMHYLFQFKKEIISFAAPQNYLKIKTS